MGFISVDARGEKRKEVEKQQGNCETMRGREREIESGESNREIGPEGDSHWHVFTRVFPGEVSIFFISFFLYLGVFLSVITPCHLPGDSSETLHCRAPLGFIENLPLRYNSTSQHARTKE